MLISTANNAIVARFNDRCELPASSRNAAVTAKVVQEMGERQAEEDAV
jgi:hypothetical protein